MTADTATSCSVSATSTDCISQRLEEPEVVAGICAALAVILLILICVIWRILKMAKAAAGPHAKAVQLVAAGHQKASKECHDEAFELYRAAFNAVCRRAVGSKVAADDKTAAIAAADQALAAYNGAVGIGVYLSLAFSSDVSEPAPTIVTVNFQNGLGVDLDSDFRICFIAEDGDGAVSDLQLGDFLIAINGEDIGSLASAAVQQQLTGPGSATFQRCGNGCEEPGHGPPVIDVEAVGGGNGNGTPATRDEMVFVCCRCATRNRAEDTCASFRCFSCQATALPWKHVVGPSAASAGGAEPAAAGTMAAASARTSRRAPCLCIGKQSAGYLEMQDVSWEESGLQSAVKHRTGYGQACEPPEGCVHHRQVGATCGMAAVNNLMTNCGVSAVDADRMIGISDRLTQAEESLRDDSRPAEDAAEEPYTVQRGGHFDVQTLQIALEEAGFLMWYTAPQQLDQEALFEPKEGKELAGYVLHRRDALNRMRDHWYVVRRHGAANGGKAPRLRILLQDSMYEQVFELTSMEAKQLLSNTPQGGLFTVLRVGGVGGESGGEAGETGGGGAGEAGGGEAAP